MKLSLALVFLIAAVPNVAKGGKGASKGKNPEAFFNGLTAEAGHLPLVLKCGAAFKNILLGSVTIDSKEVDEKLIKSARKECEKTQQRLSTGPEAERLICSLEFDKAKNLTGNEHFRAVYQCYESVPHNWEAEKSKTVSQKKAGKYVTLNSEEKAILKISSVKINGVPADTVKFPELKHDAIERECYMQIVNNIAESKGSKKYNCAIMNKAEYGGTLEITYLRHTPTMEH